MSFRVVLTGGGSGGHAYPLMAVAASLRAKAGEKGMNLRLWVIGDDGFLARAAQESGIKFTHIYAGKLRRYFSPQTLIDIFKVPVGFLQSLWYLYWIMPDAVFSKGGYDSVPVVLAARLYFIPVYVHESDSYPGLANSLAAKFARKIFVSFETVSKYLPGLPLELVGNPIRRELIGGDKSAGMQALGLRGDKKVILILGGSQGAKQINDVIVSSLVRMAEHYQIIHQCGETQYDSVKSEVDRVIKEGEGKYADAISGNYHLYPFLGPADMASGYAAADLIISRAGAGAIFEIAALAKPCIIIPLHPSAGDHQFLNSVEFSKFGAVVVEGDSITPNILLDQIERIFRPENYEQLSRQIRGFARPDASDRIAGVILGN